MQDLGAAISYEVLAPRTPVYSSDGEHIGEVAHVLADTAEDVFDGVVIDEHEGPGAASPTPIRSATSTSAACCSRSTPSRVVSCLARARTRP